MKLTCPECERPCSNHGAESRGDGDMYDVWACDRCHRRCYEVHAGYCECIDCQGGCGRVHRCDDEPDTFYIGDPY